MGFGRDGLFGSESEVLATRASLLGKENGKQPVKLLLWPSIHASRMPRWESAELSQLDVQNAASS